MKAAITDGKGNLWLDEVPVPVPNDYQCLCKIQVCATCTGTDKKHIHNQLPWQQEYPGILGHESIGTVIKAGSKVRAFKEGDMVIRPTAVYNGERLAGYTSLWGGFAEYGLVTDGQAYLADYPDGRLNPYVQYQLKIPKGLEISPAEAAMLITLKEVAGYAESVGVTMNHSVLLLGLGGVGLAFCEACRLLGAYPLMVAARRPQDFERALRIGADDVICTETGSLEEEVKKRTDGLGVQHVIDCTGSVDYVKSALGCLAPTGKVSPYSTYPKGIDIHGILPEEVLRFGKTGEVRTHQWACSAYRHRLLHLHDLYSHTLPFSQIVEGFQMLQRKEAFKIVFEMES